MSNEKFKVKYGLTVGENTASIDTAGKITAKEIVLTTYPTTKEITEKDNLYYTDTRARAAVSIIDAGGDGSFAYNNTTGIFTYTGPSATEVRAHLDTKVIKNTRADGSEQLIGNLEYNKTTGEFTYTCPTTEQLRSLIEVDSLSALKLSDTGVFSTNASNLSRQVRIGRDAGQGAEASLLPTVSIGTEAGKTRQAPKTIIINADDTPLNTPDTNTLGEGLYIKPIRDVEDVPAGERTAKKLQYNPDTGEVYYADDADYLDQGVGTRSNPQFGSVKLLDYTLVGVNDLAEARIAWDPALKKPVYYDGAKWCYFDGTAV
jgi:hypothetical protein